MNVKSSISLNSYLTVDTLCSYNEHRKLILTRK